MQTDHTTSAKEPEHIDLIVGPGREKENRTFGELLASLRKRAQITRTDAASQLGFSSEYLRLIELGKRTPALGKMQEFLDLYQADGAVETIQPGGDKPDLLLRPFPQEDPLIIQFASRIRETRQISSPRVRDKSANDRKTYSRTRAERIGDIVTLLVEVDVDTLERVHEYLHSKM